MIVLFVIGDSAAAIDIVIVVDVVETIVTRNGGSKFDQFAAL